MAFGLIQFILTRKNLGEVGLKPSIELKIESKEKR